MALPLSTLVAMLVAPGGAAAAPARPVTPVRSDTAVHLTLLHAEQAWRHATGAGVVVAVLDSGVDASHPDLAGRVLPGRDFVDGSTDGRVDPVGHGTAVASLITGAGGLAPDAVILPVRVLDEHNRYQRASTVAAGVRWAVGQGAQVINLSLGGPGYSVALDAAITEAMAHDVVVVACTGNLPARPGGDGTPEADLPPPDRIWYPAREPGVVAVSGLTWSDPAASPRRWPRALTGPGTVLSAPAEVTAAAPGGGHHRVQGTSFSAALVTAGAALVRSRYPEAPAGEVIARLITGARDVGPQGRDPWSGFGVLDPLASLTVDVPRITTNPLDLKSRHARTGIGEAPSRPDPVGTGEVTLIAVPPPSPAVRLHTRTAVRYRSRCRPVRSAPPRPRPPARPPAR